MYKKIVGIFILLMLTIGFNISYGIDIQGEKNIGGNKGKQQLQGNYNTIQGEIDKIIREQVRGGGDTVGDLRCANIVPILRASIRYEETKRGTFLAGVNSCSELDLNGDGRREIILSLKYVSYSRYREHFRSASKLYVYNPRWRRVDIYNINGDYRIVNIKNRSYVYGVRRIKETSFFKMTDIYGLDDNYNFKAIYKTNGYAIDNGGNIVIRGGKKGILYFYAFANANINMNSDYSRDYRDIGVFILDNNKYINLGAHRIRFYTRTGIYRHYTLTNVIDVSDYLGLTDKLAFLSLKTYDKAQLVVIDRNGNVRYINFKDVIYPHNNIINLKNNIVISRYNDKRRYRIAKPLYPGYVLILNKEKLKNVINSNTREISDYIYKTNGYIIWDSRGSTEGAFKTARGVDNIAIVFLGAVGYLFDDTRGKLYDLGGMPIGKRNTDGKDYTYDFKLKSYPDVVLFNLYFFQEWGRDIEEAKNMVFIYNKNNGRLIKKDIGARSSSYMLPAKIYNGQIVMHLNRDRWHRDYVRMWIVGADGSVRDLNAIGRGGTNLYKFLTTIEYDKPIYTNALAGYLEDNEIKESLNKLGKGQYVLGHKGDGIVVYNLSNGEISYDASKMVSKGDYKVYYSFTLHKGFVYYKGKKIEDISITQKPSLYNYGDIMIVKAGNFYLYKNGERIPYNYEPLYKTIYDDGKVVIKVFKYPETGFKKTLIYYKNGDTQKLIKEIENVNVDETNIRKIGNYLVIEGGDLKIPKNQAKIKRWQFITTEQRGVRYQSIYGKLLEQRYVIWENVNDYINFIFLELKYFNTQIHRRDTPPRRGYYNFKIFYKDGTIKTVAFVKGYRSTSTSVLDFETIKSNIVKINNNIFMIFNKVIIDRKNIVYINWKMLNLKPINNKTLIIYQIDNRVYSSFTDRPLYKLNLYSIPTYWYIRSSKIKIMKANEYYKNCNVGDNVYVIDATFYIQRKRFRRTRTVKVVKNIDINTENFVNVNCQR